MPPSVRDVVALSALSLQLLSGDAPELDRAVRWVATSELEDPCPYLEGGELLLTLGMRLAAEDADAADEYITRLVAAGVPALGLGVGIVHESIPRVLVEAARRHRLPLLEVPGPVPFIAVSKAVSHLITVEENEQTARSFTAQRDLIRIALAPGDTTRPLLSRLVRHLGGFALVLDTDGGVVHAAPPSAAARAEDLGGEVARVRARGLLASAAIASEQEYVVLQPLGLPSRPGGFLVVGTGGPLGPGDQAVVNLTVSLLSLALTRQDDATRGDDGVRAAAMRLLLAGHGPELPLEDLGWSGARGAVRAVVVRPADPPFGAEAARARVAAALPGAAVSRSVLPDALELVIAICPTLTAVDKVRSALAVPEVAAAGIGDVADAVDAESLLRSLSRARLALAGIREGVRSYDDTGGGLDALLDPMAADAWAVALLAPLDTPGERADLAATLRAWLNRHGQVDAAAADLGVHRHTVRHRLQRAEALLGRPLDDAGVRAELYLALSRRPG
ncbi:MAG TPA: PucR family transcriptional regulator ligand-binding domain-containing protein [Candidatus Nanopelagicales bacterium]|jgi:purine catabolism regulator